MINKIATKIAISGFVFAVICLCLVIGYSAIEKEHTNGHDSVSVAKNFVKEHPQDPNAYADLGNAWRDQGQYNLAIENHKKALLLDNTDAATHSELGDDYMLANQKNNARAEWTKAVQMDAGIHPSEARLHAEDMLNKYQ